MSKRCSANIRNGEHWLAGNWSVSELVDRLEQVGVKADLAAE